MSLCLAIMCFLVDVHQLKLILAMRGTPPPEYFSRIVSEPTRQFLQSLPFVRKAPLRSVFPRASDLALDLLDKMLMWSPEERLTAEAALAHPYLARYHNPAEEPTCPPFDPRFENDAINEVALRALVTKEVDFDHIRWMQLAEHRRVLEEQDEVHKQVRLMDEDVHFFMFPLQQQATIELARKQLEQARLQELAAAQKKQSEEEALFRKQQELEFAQRQVNFVTPPKTNEFFFFVRSCCNSNTSSSCSSNSISSNSFCISSNITCSNHNSNSSSNSPTPRQRSRWKTGWTIRLGSQCLARIPHPRLLPGATS